MAQTATPFDERAALGLSVLAVAYLTALQQGKWVESSGLMSAFQQGYNQYRGSLVAAYASIGADASGILPLSLPINGQFSPKVQRALVGALSINRQEHIDLIATMPSTSAGGVGTWLNATLSILTIPSEQALYGRLVNAGANAGPAASSWLFTYVSDIVTSSTAENVVDDIIASNPAPPQPSSSLDTPTQLPTAIITAERRQPRSDLWTYFLWGALIVGGGTAIYFGKRGRWPWQKRGRRRRRRR